MATVTDPAPAPPPAPPADVPVILPLENGDHLSRDEFERRYAAMPGVKKAELIEGVVFMPSPVRRDRHGRPHVKVLSWLDAYERATPGVVAAGDSTVRLDNDNEPQPDGVLMIEPGLGGQARVSADDYIEGAPELAAEVAASSAAIDLHTKLKVYRRNGVREYLVWRVLDGAIDWFALRGGRYEPLPADAAGVVRSEVFPGLWLDTAALVRLDGNAVLAALQAGLATPEHAAFAARLGEPGPPA